MVLKSKSLAVRTNFLVLIVVVLYLITQLAVQFSFGQEWLINNFYLFLMGIQVLVIFLPALFFTCRHHLEPTAFLRIRRLTFPEALLIILMASAASFIASTLNTFVVYLLEKLGSVSLEGIPTPKSLQELWVQIFVIALLPAICEEFFFRGVIFRSFESFGTWPAIGASAFYFALFHFDLRNLLGPLFLGVLITWYCYRTGSILAAVLAHFVNNLLAVLVGWFSRNTAEAPMLLTGDSLRQLLFFACLAGTVLLILMKAFEGITRKKVQKKPITGSFSVSILFHWPACLFYSTYLIIGFIFITSLQVQ